MCDKDTFTCPDGECVDTRFDCSRQQCGNFTYCEIAKMCVSDMARFCVECNVNNPYRCTNGECISRDYFCDKTYQCADQSDENSYECFEKGGGFKFPNWTIQIVLALVAVVFGVIAFVLKKRHRQRLIADQARNPNSSTTVSGVDQTGNVPPPPPGAQMATNAPPPSYNTAMQTSQPSKPNGGMFASFFSSNRSGQAGAQPPAYSAATGGSYPMQTYPTQPVGGSSAYPAQAYPAPQQAPGTQAGNYDTQYGMQGQQSAFTYN